MNRSSKDNLVVAITPKFQKQVREPYFIFTNRDDAEQKIRGIWFHNSDEREAVSNTLDRIVKSMTTSARSSIETASNKLAHRSNITTSKATASLLSALKIDKKDDQSTQKENAITNNIKRSDEDEKKLIQNVEMDKKALQLTLMSLIQDDRFIDLIHAQYLKIVRSRGHDSRGHDQEGL